MRVRPLFIFLLLFSPFFLGADWLYAFRSTGPFIKSSSALKRSSGAIRTPRSGSSPLFRARRSPSPKRSRRHYSPIRSSSEMLRTPANLRATPSPRHSSRFIVGQPSPPFDPMKGLSPVLRTPSPPPKPVTPLMTPMVISPSSPPRGVRTASPMTAPVSPGSRSVSPIPFQVPPRSPVPQSRASAVTPRLHSMKKNIPRNPRQRPPTRPRLQTAAQEEAVQQGSMQQQAFRLNQELSALQQKAQNRGLSLPEQMRRQDVQQEFNGVLNTWRSQVYTAVASKNTSELVSSALTRAPVSKALGMPAHAPGIPKILKKQDGSLKPIGLSGEDLHHLSRLPDRDVSKIFGVPLEHVEQVRQVFKLP